MISKNCEKCGRTIEYRKKWAKNWDQVRYCGEKCRRNRNSEGYEAAILELLSQRSKSLSICPSEVLDGENKKNPRKMEEVRQAARRLVHRGLVEITQKNQVVDPSQFRGPIRIRMK